MTLSRVPARAHTHTHTQTHTHTSQEYVCLARAEAGAVARAAHAEGGEGWFEVDAPIGRLADQGAPVYGVVDEARGGKASFTRFETLAWALGGEGGGNGDTAGAAHTHHTLAAGALLLPDEGVWLGRARPRTGRTHQIRVHACAAGLPLLGDTLYAPESGARERDGGWMR